MTTRKPLEVLEMNREPLSIVNGPQGNLKTHDPSMFRDKRDGNSDPSNIHDMYIDRIRQLEGKLLTAEELSRSVLDQTKGEIRNVQSQYESEIKQWQDKNEALRRQNLLISERLERERERSSRANDTIHVTDSWAKVTDIEWKDMNERIDTLIRENDILVEHNRTTQRELDKLREHMDDQAREVHVAGQELASIRDQNLELQREIENLDDHSMRLERELKLAQSQTTELQLENQELKENVQQRIQEIKAASAQRMDMKRALDEITGRYQAHVAESGLLAQRERSLIDSLKAMEADLDDSKIKYDTLMGEHTSLQNEHAELRKIVKNLELKLETAEQKELEHFQGVQTITEKIEDALLDRDKALAREQQAQGEIERLNQRLQEIPAKCRERASKDIETLRSQYTTDRKKWAEEIHVLESKLASIQSQSERAIREKRMAESELEKMTKHIPTENDRLTATIEELNHRLRTSERERIEAAHKLESLHQKYMRDQNRFEKEKEQISSKGEDSYKRLRKAERELEDTKEDRLRLLSKISDLDHALKLSNEAITRLTAKYDSDKAMISERSDSQVSDLTTKLETVTEAHARTCRELQQLLSEQRRMAERWKDESTQMASHYEALLTDSKTQTQRYIQRVEELEALNERLSVTKKELLAQVTDEKKSHARIQGLLYNLESKNETVVKQLHELMEREKDWAEEKRRLQRSIDRIQLEKERERRDRTKEIALSNHMSSKTAPIIRDLQETVQSDEREFGEHELRALKSDLQRVKKRAHSNNIAELNDLILTMDSDSDLE